jgi:hypothetical protein
MRRDLAVALANPFCGASKRGRLGLGGQEPPQLSPQSQKQTPQRGRAGALTQPGVLRSLRGLDSSEAGKVNTLLPARLTYVADFRLAALAGLLLALTCEVGPRHTT